MAPNIYVPYVDLTRPRERRSFFAGTAKICFGIVVTVICTLPFAWSAAFTQQRLESVSAYHQVVIVDLVRR